MLRGHVLGKYIRQATGRASITMRIALKRLEVIHVQSSVTQILDRRHLLEKLILDFGQAYGHLLGKPEQNELQLLEFELVFVGHSGVLAAIRVERVGHGLYARSAPVVSIRRVNTRVIRHEKGRHGRSIPT